MLGPLFILTVHILALTCLPVGKAESCIDEGVGFAIEYVSVGEPLYAVCPLHFSFEKDNLSVTWIRNDSQTEITSDRQARVHQDQKYLKFIPADLHDSGLYQCILRNSTFCMKKISKVEVYKHDDGLCYKYFVRFKNEIAMTPSMTIECPNIDLYVSYRKIKVKWYKECQPLNLDSKHYSTSAKTLIIRNVSKQDSGNYTCEVPFMYNGVTYNISRTLEYNIIDLPKETEPVMIFPTNNILNVELGAPIALTCKVLYNGTTILFWTYKNTVMTYYTEDDRVIMGYMDTTSTEDGIQHSIALNFTKVIEEDYNKQFYCNMWTSKIKKIYVKFKRPDG